MRVLSVSASTCAACDEHFCLTGSAKGRGCQYGLCAGEIDWNNDCGLCLECVKACAYYKVAVFWRSAGRDEAITRCGEAWQAIVMFAFAWDGLPDNLVPDMITGSTPEQSQGRPRL